MEASIQHEKYLVRSADGVELWPSTEERNRWEGVLSAQLRGAVQRSDIDPERFLQEINAILCGVTISSVRGTSTPETTRVDESLAQLDSHLSKSYCSDHGAYMTPASAARDLVALIPELDAGPIIDPACGHGEILLAAHRRWPTRDLVGVEMHPGLAVVAALRLWEEARGSVRIYVGDGLALPTITGDFAAVIGNPPYLGEKGQAQFFRTLREEHSRMESIFSARMDLIYPFLARGIELARAGGWNCWLTPPYWLYADGARKLRGVMQQTLDARFFVDLKHTGLFEATPGDEFLMIALQRRDENRKDPPAEGRWWSGDSAALHEALKVRDQGNIFGEPLAPELLVESGWHPFTPVDILEWRRVLSRRGSRFEDLAIDFQGFVSGADRVSRRHIPPLSPDDIELRESIFLCDGPEIPEDWKEAPKGLVQPVLRSRNIKANEVIRQPTSDAWALYIDDEAGVSFDEVVFEKLLGRFRPVLERRREVERGNMPWYRLHWPRNRAAMSGPKLVVPRRAKKPQFTLDLSGAMISSDCTFIIAPPETLFPIRYLCALMLLLNDDRTGRYLRYFGKRKGDMLEFYSSPLRRLILPARWVEGRLELDKKIFTALQRGEFIRRLDHLLTPHQAG